MVKLFNPWVYSDITDYGDDYVPDYDPTGGDILIESAGYIPKEMEILNLYRSGESLDFYRSQLYPDMVPATSDDNPEFDPTGQFGYDFFDWHADVSFVRNNIEREMRHSNLTPPDGSAPILDRQTATSSPPDLKPEAPSA